MNQQTLHIMISAMIATAAVMLAGLGIGLASEKTTGNMTMGNTTGGNMTEGNSTEGTGGIASLGDESEASSGDESEASSGDESEASSKTHTTQPLCTLFDSC